MHGSTVTINAVLERKGARTGLITTKGFRDVYEIGRGNRPEGYNLFFKRPVPLVPRDLRLEVDERLYATGEVLKPLDEDVRERDDQRAQKQRAWRASPCACCTLTPMRSTSGASAICCASNFPKPTFHCRMKFSASSGNTSEPRRPCSNSYVGPLVSRYLISLEKMLAEGGFRGTFRVMQSNGGVMSAETAKKNAGDDDGIGAGGRRDRGGALGGSARLPAYYLFRHGRHDGEVEPDQRFSS